MNTELINVTQAQKLLSLSKKKMAALVADGVLPYQIDLLDKRVKLVRVQDVERLLELRFRKAA